MIVYNKSMRYIFDSAPPPLIDETIVNSMLRETSYDVHGVAPVMFGESGIGMLSVPVRRSLESVGGLGCVGILVTDSTEDIPQADLAHFVNESAGSYPGITGLEVQNGAISLSRIVGALSCSPEGVNLGYYRVSALNGNPRKRVHVVTAGVEVVGYDGGKFDTKVTVYSPRTYSRLIWTAKEMND